MIDKPRYTFLPWARLGIANSIAQADGDASVTIRASIPIDLTLSTEAKTGTPGSQLLHKDVLLYGPGDIVGVDASSILRTEPQNWITSFESNLLAYVEFYDEDMPWRYTPAAATAERLRPWLALVVLTEDEFADDKTPGRPLPAFDLASGKQASTLFPPPAELWAWAHVHVNRSLVGPPAADLEKVLAEDPDLASSRILCPRRLAANTTYHAFLVPAFETGRLAGLGLDISPDVVATKSAWADAQAKFPYYHRFRFRTGFGDFEYLVRLLKPQPADKRVGVRDLDVLHPGSRLPPIDSPPELGGVLKLGGALRVPLATLPPADQLDVKKFDEWDQPAPHAFQKALAKLVDLPDDYAQGSPSDTNGDGDPDPIVTPPLYGRWHALTTRLLTERDGSPAAHATNWVHDLNLDPRWRVAAGLGTRIVQKHQEEYMDAAWQQVGEVLAANRLLQLMQLSRAAAGAAYRKHIEPLDAARGLVVTAPVQPRVLRGDVTVRYAVATSTLPYASLAPAFRAMVRSRGRIAKRFGMTAAGASATIVSRIDAANVRTDIPYGAPSGAITIAGMASAAVHAQPKQHAIDPALRGRVAASLSLSPAKQTAESVDALHGSPTFVATRVVKQAAPAPVRAGALGTPVATADSADARRFKRALKDTYELASQLPPAAVRAPLHVASASACVVGAIDPETTVPMRWSSMTRMPARISAVQKEPFVSAMIYPELDVPMYEPLAKLSAELFLPNINLIPHNSITLLENNQRFIESYMMGLNHEMARELLWREYPTDQRGSVFRQFWDVSSAYPGNPAPADIREKLRDIPPIHTWGQTSDLGEHNQRETHGDKAQLVLVIRGELLKRYPNCVIFAIKAEWAKDKHGALDASQERSIVNLDAADLADPPKSKVRMPLYEARVSPDITFVGFDLEALEARGAAEGETPKSNNAGWFFVLQERPGEPRFGIDLPAPPGGEPARLVNWNSLDWDDVGVPEGGVIHLDKSLKLVPYDPVVDQENTPRLEDAAAHWTPGTTAAQLAYILYQVPVLVAVHAHRMLP